MKQHNFTYHNVSRETFDSANQLFNKHVNRIEKYMDLLSWWNKRVNLVSRSVSRETLREHIRHSILLSKIPAFQNSQLVVDAGTGGGLPGIPLSIVNPQKQIICNDIVKKKVLAVKQITKKIGLQNASTTGGSVADLEQKEHFCLISKHAFKINDLYHMTAHLPWEKMIFYKGEDFKNELDGIDCSLQIKTYRLFRDDRLPFYKGKVLVALSR